MTAKILAGYDVLRNFDCSGQPVMSGRRLLPSELSADDAAPYLAVGVIVEALEEPVAETVTDVSGETSGPGSNWPSGFTETETD